MLHFFDIDVYGAVFVYQARHSLGLCFMHCGDRRANLLALPRSAFTRRPHFRLASERGCGTPPCPPESSYGLSLSTHISEVFSSIYRPGEIILFFLPFVDHVSVMNVPRSVHVTISPSRTSG